MTTRAFQKVYTKIDNITKATITLRATGVGNDELATVGGKLAQVVKIMGETIEQVPSTANMLNIFEPTTLPIAMSPWPPIAEIKLTASSGIDVPTAITVRPTINSGT